MPATPWLREATKAERALAAERDDEDRLKTHRLIEDDADFAEVIEALSDEPAYAVDTEFHRERTYYPKVALMQLAWPGGCVLIDPLAVDLRPFERVLKGPGLAVMHAAAQDLLVLQRACGTVPAALFDTQIAAGFVGFSTPSLATLAFQILGVDLPKANRLTDWLRRPLDVDQQLYAASDVHHLLNLASILKDELSDAGRLTWAEEECEVLRSRSWLPIEPELAWTRLKECRQLRGSARAVAQAVAAWRERRAAELDVPIRFVLADMAISGIAHRPPKTLDQLAAIRGMDQRVARGETGELILQAVKAGLRNKVEVLRAPRTDEIDRDMNAAVGLVSAWLAQMSRTLRIEASQLATRADVGAFLNEDADARLAQGWRAGLLGEPIRQLLSGNYALAFDGKGGLALEQRSGLPVNFDLPTPSMVWDQPKRTGDDPE